MVRNYNAQVIIGDPYESCIDYHPRHQPQLVELEELTSTFIRKPAPVEFELTLLGVDYVFFSRTNARLAASLAAACDTKEEFEQELEHVDIKFEYAL